MFNNSQQKISKERSKFQIIVNPPLNMTGHLPRKVQVWVRNPFIFSPVAKLWCVVELVKCNHDSSMIKVGAPPESGMYDQRNYRVYTRDAYGKKIRECDQSLGYGYTFKK